MMEGVGVQGVGIYLGIVGCLSYRAEEFSSVNFPLLISIFFYTYKLLEA